MNKLGICFLQSVMLVALWLATGCAARDAATGNNLRADKPDPPGSHLPDAKTFQEYWYPHGAELSRYALKQARYGDYHQGDAILVFVTENFDPDDQVKSDAREPVAAGAVPVLKLNATRQFNTGVYQYNLMTSVFSSIDPALSTRPFKITTSSQEWCGHTFVQLNQQKDGYRYRQFSYFQSEGDLDRHIEAPLTEDGLWTLLRIKPDALPVGKVSLLPGTQFLRLSHREPRMYQAEVSIQAIDQKGMDGELLNAYMLVYPALNRTLEIRYHRNFPYVIEGWTEEGPALNGKVLKTEAVRTHSIMLDYWSRHGVDDRQFRLKLGLPADSSFPQ